MKDMLDCGIKCYIVPTILLILLFPCVVYSSLLKCNDWTEIFQTNNYCSQTKLPHEHHKLNQICIYLCLSGWEEFSHELCHRFIMYGADRCFSTLLDVVQWAYKIQTHCTVHSYFMFTQTVFYITKITVSDCRTSISSFLTAHLKCK